MATELQGVTELLRIMREARATRVKLPDGTEKPIEGKNPYRQALDCKYGISDLMHSFAKRRWPTSGVRKSA